MCAIDRSRCSIGSSIRCESRSRDSCWAIPRPAESGSSSTCWRRTSGGWLPPASKARTTSPSLDEYNYDDWLRMNRVAERTLRSPLDPRRATIWPGVRGRRPEKPTAGGGAGDQRRLPVLLHVQGRAVLAHEGRDGRGGLRTDVPGPAQPRGEVSLLPPARRHRAQRRRHAP